MERHDKTTEEGQAEAPDAVPRWPLYVRVLAVCYVLTYPVQALAFVALVLPAAFLTGLVGPLDGVVLGLRLASVLVLVLCWGFRYWFVRWGRRNYPTGKPE